MSYKAITDLIINHLSSKTEINMDYRDIYSYALEKYISGLINTIVFTAVAFLFRIPLETVVFFAFYAPLRKYAGGIHAKTRVQCTILSLVIFLMLIHAAKLICMSKYWFLIAAIALAFAITAVFLFAPVDSEKRRLSEDLKNHYRGISRKIVVSEGILILLATGLLPSVKQYIVTAVMALFILGIFIIPYKKNVTNSPSE